MTLSILEHATLVAGRIRSNPEDWEKRQAALLAMRREVEGAGDRGVFNADLWRVLREPLESTLNDLRSAIVRDACHVLEALSTASGDLLSGLLRDLLPIMLQLVASANSVIASHVDACLKHVIRNTQFPRQLKEIEFRVKTTRSKDLRVSISSYLLLILREWPPASIDRVVGHVGGMIEALLADASSDARADARASFEIFREHWPQRAGNILQGADPRTRKALGGGSVSPGGHDSVGCRERLARGMSPSGKTVRGVSSSPASRDARVSREGLSRTMTPSPAARRRGSSLAPSSARASGQSSASSRRRQLGDKPADRRRAPSSPPIRGRGGGGRDSDRSSVMGKGATVDVASTGSAASAAGNDQTSKEANLGRTIPRTTGKPRPPASSLRSTHPNPKRSEPRSGVAPATPSVRSARLASPREAGASRRASPLAKEGLMKVSTNHDPRDGPSNDGRKATDNLSRSTRSALKVGAMLEMCPTVPPTPGSTRRRTISATPTNSTASAISMNSTVSAITAPASSVVCGGRARPVRGSAKAHASVEPQSTLVAGDMVRLMGGCAGERRGIARYVGLTQFAKGIWVGVELSESEGPSGNNDGTVKGVAYFRCPPARGIFVRPHMVEVEPPAEASRVGWPGVARVEEQSRDESSAGPVTAAATAGNDHDTKRAGEELLRCLKMFMTEINGPLRDGMKAAILELEGLLESNCPLSNDRVYFYRDVAGRAVEASLGVASRMKGQLEQVEKAYPRVFNGVHEPLTCPCTPAEEGDGFASGSRFKPEVNVKGRVETHENTGDVRRKLFILEEGKAGPGEAPLISPLASVPPSSPSVRTVNDLSAAIAVAIAIGVGDTALPPVSPSSDGETSGKQLGNADFGTYDAEVLMKDISRSGDSEVHVSCLRDGGTTDGTSDYVRGQGSNQHTAKTDGGEA